MGFDISQDAAALIGNMANYSGLPPFPTPDIAAGGTTEQFSPLSAEVEAEGDTWTVRIGYAGQCAVLPDSIGTMYPCVRSLTATDPWETFTGILQNSDPNLARFDVVYAQATPSNFGGEGGAELDASFLYARGDVGYAAPYDQGEFLFGGEGYAIVLVICFPPNNGIPTVVPLVPGLSQTGQSAAVVTAAPFNAPFYTNGALPHGVGSFESLPDSMPAIQQALDAVGPGGAIYIPSGMYIVRSTATTSSGPISGAATGADPSLKAVLNGVNGQTIIFGGQVTFIAAADVPALQLGQGCVTIGTAKFCDTPVNQQFSLAEAVSVSGFGLYTIGGVNTDDILDGQKYVTVLYDPTVDDPSSNPNGFVLLAGKIASTGDGTVTIDTTPSTTATFVGDAGFAMQNIGTSYSDIPVDHVPFLVEGMSVYIADSEGHWILAVLTAVVQEEDAGTITFTSIAQSHVASDDVSMAGDASVMPTDPLVSSTGGDHESTGKTIPAGATVQLTTSATLRSFAVQVSGSNTTVDSLFVKGWANGVMLGSSLAINPDSDVESPQAWYLQNGLGDSEIKSVRSIAVLGIGVQIPNIGGVHDSHIGSIYCNSYSLPKANLGVCGVDVFGTRGPSCNSIKIDHIEVLGFNGPFGPIPETLPPSGTTMPAAGLCLRGTSVQSFYIAIAFLVTNSVGVYMDASTTDIRIGLMQAGGGGFTKTFASPAEGLSADPTNGFSVLCNGTSADPVTDIWFGSARCITAQAANSLDGIYLAYTTQFHADFAQSMLRNRDGVRLVGSCTSIGFDHLITATSNQGGVEGTGVAAIAVETDAPSFVSFDKLDISGESENPPVSLDSATFVSYNDMGSYNGYYTSAGAGQDEGGGTPGATIGAKGNATPTALRIGSVAGSSLYSVIGTTPASGAGTGNSVNGVYGVLLAIWNALIGSGTSPLLAFDAGGHLGIAGDLAVGGKLLLPSGSATPVTISAGSGPPGIGTPGNGQNGSVYTRTDASTAGHHLYVYGGASGIVAGSWIAVG